MGVKWLAQVYKTHCKAVLLDYAGSSPATSTNYKKMFYINYKFNNTTGNETLDEAKTINEARRLLSEYNVADPYGDYWISDRCCKNWK